MFGKVASFLGLLLISAGVAGFIVSLVTNQWGTISLTMDLEKMFNSQSKSKLQFGEKKDSSGNMFNGKTAYVDMHFGLKQICPGNVRIDPELLRVPQVKVNVQSFSRQGCQDTDIGDKEDLMSDEIKQNPTWKLYKKISSALRNTMICIGIATGLAIVGLIVSFVKLPIWYSGRVTVPVSITMAVCGLAVVSSVAGIVIFHQNVQIKKEIDNMMKIGGINSPKISQMLKMLEIDEKWGYSHHLACVGIGCMFLAVFMNIFEIACAANTSNDGYEMTLVKNSVYA